jgi:hypothetical protein
LSSAEAARVYAASGVPWYSMLTKDFLDDIVSRCVPGRVHVIAVLVTVLVVLSTSDTAARRDILLHLALALCALFLVERTISGISAGLFPSIAYLQFPWRFLGIFNLFASAGFAASISKTSPLPLPVKVMLAAAVPLMCVLVYFRHIPSQEPRFLPTRTREGIRESLTTLDHENKYMPTGAELLSKPAPKVLLEVPDGECFELELLPNDYRYSVLSRSAQIATFHQYYFSGWRAEVDGIPSSLLKSKDGLCQLEISAGIHEVRLRFVRTLIHTVALSMSVLGWAALGAWGFLAAWFRFRRRISP